MNEQPGDRELRRLIELDASAIPNAPSREEMVTRVERAALGKRGVARGFNWTPAPRLVVALALLAAFAVGTVAVGSWLARRNAIVVAPTASPVPSPSLAPAAPVGSMAPGTYTVRSDTLTPFTVTVPAGWSYHDGFLSKGGDFRQGTGVAMSPWVVTHVFDDACREASTMIEVGTKDELVAALTAQTGHSTRGPEERSFGGLPATWLEFSVPAEADTEPCRGLVHLWPDSGGDDSGGEPMSPGQTTTIYITEIEGRVTVVVGVRHVQSRDADVDELLAILGSVRFWQ